MERSIANRSTEDLWAVGEASIRFDGLTNQSVSNTKQPLFPFHPLLFAFPAMNAIGSACAPGLKWHVASLNILLSFSLFFAVQRYIYI